MAPAASAIRFTATLHRPADAPDNATWTFLVLPKQASSRLPTRGVTTIEGTLNDRPFRANVEPDGEKSHWLKVPRALRAAAGAAPGDTVTLEIRPAAEQLEPPVPADLRKALTASPAAARLWAAITPAARRDWIQWLDSAKQAETRARRVVAACDMLSKGKRRVCCFDRSGVYSRGSMGAPRPLD